MRRNINLLIVSFVLITGIAMANKKETYTNRLSKEKSPYLLQHAHNPVDWFSWSDEAFDKAKKEDKPLFVSIGYSTCHWCHVMEEEAFARKEIADILNKNFISIKVDREERPDLDQVYMQAVMAMTGSGGWPLNVFMTQDKKPFYGGTYFPIEDKWGRPGFKTLLLSIADTWKSHREKLIDSAQGLAAALSKQQEGKAQKEFTIDETLLKNAYEGFSGNFDPEYGGFSDAPKFPSGHSLSFLLRYYARAKEPKALAMVEKALIKMAEGGIYDQLGGGFHRYATDREWRIPHFEKMLYDQAILVRAYLEAYQATGKRKYAEIAKEVFEYVLQDMMQPEGGFYSAEDADSPPPECSKKKSAAGGKEGAFYLWTKDELAKALDKEELEIVSYYFGIKEEGNALPDPQGEFRGKNIFYIAHSIEETAQHYHKSIQEIERIIGNARRKLLSVRDKRPWPHRDDKILTDWNGLMISSLAFGSRVLDEPRYLSAAEKGAQFILKNMQGKEERLFHRYREGEAAIQGMLDDYAFFIHGLLELYEASFKPEYLVFAKRLCHEMIKLFWDENEGGFFFTAHDAEELFTRHKEIFDSAIPSGNSIALLDLLRTGFLTMDKDLLQKAEVLLKAFAQNISRVPTGCAQALSALDFMLGSKQIVLVGPDKAQDTQKMLQCLYLYFIPNKVIAFRPADNEQATEIIGLVPFLKEYVSLENKATVYLCEDYTCKLPVNSVEGLKADLEKY